MKNFSSLRRTAVVLIFFLIAQAQVEPYRIKKGLKNVANLKEFKEAVEYYTEKDFSFSQEQENRLIKNGFVVTPYNAEQFFHIYESSHFGMTPRIPNFITSDCMLQLYHLFYDFTLRTIEVEALLPALRKLTRAMIEGTERQYREVTNPELKAACLKNLSFFGVAAKLLRIEDISLPEACGSEVENELRKIEKHEKREKSSIFPWLHDYSQYIPRGHYTRSEELKRFFFVMMWYGQNSFPFESGGKRTEQQILQALLITHLLFNSQIEDKPAIHFWDKIYSITALYVGSTDDLNAHHFHKLMKEVYGEVISLEVLSDRERLDLFYKKSKELPQPKIVPQLIGIPSGLQFRFMGQRFIPDSYIMQKLVYWPERAWPKGLDVMAVLGSKRAATLLDEFYKEPEKWEPYLPEREKLKEEFAHLTEEDWYKNLFYGWLYILKTLLEERGKKYPGFMQNTAWIDKELNTVLASWAELRHDAILYGKPSGAEGAGELEEVSQPKGYAEPVPGFYQRLLKLTKLNKQILLDKGFLSKRLKEIFNRYEDLITFLKDISEKELANKPLTYEEYERIRRFGSEIENLSVSLVELDRSLPLYNWITGEKIEQEEFYLGGWFEVTGPDKDIACIADVHTSLDSCLEEAVGHINLIYVIVPIEGKLYLTRGGVFSYYEFQYPAAHRLTDEAWQEMLQRSRAPDPPSWTASFITE